MKKTLSILVFIFASGSCFSQDFKELSTKLNSFDKFEQYDSVDLEILEVANYLLSEPIQRKNHSKKYIYAVNSLVKWSNHTESYKILIFGKVIDSCQDDSLMKNIFMAAMIKYLLEERYNKGRHIYPVKQADINYGELPEVKETLLEGAKIYFQFMDELAQEKPNKELRLGLKAYKTGTLEDYMFK